MSANASPARPLTSPAQPPNRWQAFDAAELIVLELAAAVRLEGSPAALAPAPSPLLDGLRRELLGELVRRGLRPLPGPEGGLAWEDVL